MPTRRVVIATLAVIGACACSGIPSDRSAALAGYRYRLDAALVHAHTDSGATGNGDLLATIDDPLFNRLPAHERHAALAAAGDAAIGRTDLIQARDLYARATQADATVPHDWYILSLLERDLDNHTASRTHFLQLLNLRSVDVNSLDSPHISWLVAAGDPSARDRRELLQVLFDRRWDRDQSGAGAFWVELALMQLADGDRPSASLTVERIVEPFPLVMMRVDRRFDPVIDHSSPRFDVASATAQYVRDLRLRVSLEPDRLSTIIDLTSAMLMAGLHENAATRAAQAIERIESAHPDAPPFTDMHDANWIRNNHAIALRRMSRLDDALDELMAASHLREHGETNINQALNLGQFLCSLSRPADALLAIADAETSISPYGRVVKASVQLHAAILLGDTARSAIALDHLREWQDTSPTHLLDALLRLGRLDEAAALLTRLLASIDRRNEVLLWSQTFLTPDPLPGDVGLVSARATLLQRDDVRSAILRVGHLGDWPLFNELGTQ